MVRMKGLVAVVAVAVTVSAPAAFAGQDVTEMRSYVVGGGKPRGVIEGQTWGTYAMLRDASDHRVGDASIECAVEKARDKRVIAECTHALRVDGRGTLLLRGVHHYKDQTVMPGTADPMRLMVVGGTGDYASASGTADVLEVLGGYSYRYGSLG
ncbi:hypothetical protein [Yinghuangia sp. YIM S09857]|uniref:hypothetical protein n=1 Tax=Yinghuangia sp. YIM S09857 TaxID=3436929 RepID=UPI003F535928